VKKKDESLQSVERDRGAGTEQQSTRFDTAKSHPRGISPLPGPDGAGSLPAGAAWGAAGEDPHPGHGGVLVARALASFREQHQHKHT